jgi:hypothetical protein
VGAKTYAGLLLGVVAAGALVRLFHFDVTIGSDDQAYVIAARQLVGHDPVPLWEGMYSRIGWRAFLALSTWPLGGPTLERTAVVMFLLSSGATLLVGLIARDLFGRGASLFAAALHATWPIGVLFDVVTLADSLAVPLLLLSVWLFLGHLRGGGLAPLVWAGAAAALLASVKDYFLLVFPCFALATWRHGGAWRGRCGRVLLLGGLAAGGVALTCLLHQLESGDALRAARYARYYRAQPAEYFTDLGTALQLRYLQWLLLDQREFAGTGVLYALGLLAAPALARRSEGARLVALVGLAFFLFLSFMPVRRVPLLFVEQQRRYGTALEPFAAVLTGGALGLILRACPDLSLRRAGATFVAVCCAVNAWVPGPFAPVLYGRHTVGDGARRSVAEARRRGLGRVVLPCYYRAAVPDSFGRQGVELCFADPTPPGEPPPRVADLGRPDAFLRPGTAVFLPDYMAVLDPEQYARLARRLKAAGYAPVPLSCPDTSLGRLLERLGVEERDRATRWLTRLGFHTARDRLAVGKLFVKGP